MGQFEKEWDELTIADNFIFCKVMEREDLCKEFLEILLKVRIDKISYLKTENVIENFYDSRGVRLDVFVKDSDRVFDIEVQTGNYDDLILRSRYYLSSSDVATTKRRTQFRKIKETYIIFICLDDPFGAELPVYTRKTIFAETDKVPYDDKVHNVFYNCREWNKVKDPEVRDVLKFISGLKGETDFVQKVEEAVEDAKADSSVKDEFMYVADIIEEEKELAMEAGIAKGKAEGAAIKALENARNLLRENISPEIIAKCIGLPLEKVMELKNSKN